MPKNVLWIMADQLRWDYLSCYGATHIETPNIDWLARQGMRFALYRSKVRRSVI